MALTLDQLNSTTKRYFQKKIVDQAYDNSPFFKTLKSDNKISVQGGERIQFPVNYRKLGQSKSQGPREQVVFTAKDTITGGVDTWKFYTGQVMLPWDDLVKNRGTAQIVNLSVEKTKELERDMLDQLSTDLFATSQGTNAITPLAVIVDSATSYAGIAVADAATWAGIEDGTATTLTMYGANSLTANINDATRGTHGPTLHITTRDGFSKFESILQPQQRYEDKKMANLGFSTLTLKGKPVVADPYCTSTYWYGLDMSQFELVVQEGYDAGPTPGDWMDLEILGYIGSKAKTASFVGNVVCHCRNTSFKMTTLTYTN